MPTASRLTIALACLVAAQFAAAKLPAPSEEAQAKAAEAADKTAWTGKVAAYQLCKAQDRVVSTYRARRLINDKDLQEPLDTTPCIDPGPFAAAAPAMEKAGAHSAPGGAAPAAPASTPEASASAPKS